MTEIVKETVTTQGDINTTDQDKATGYQTAEYLIYFFFGLLEVLLVFRLIFKLTGASMGSLFVDIVYGLTGIFTMPFRGIFREATTSGIETIAILEPSTLISIIVYAVLAIGIVKLVQIVSGNKQKES